MQRPVWIKVLHGLVALAVAHQLLISTIMHPPVRGGEGDFWFELHEFAGLASLVLLVVFTLALLLHRGSGAARLFPWLSPSGWAALGTDVALHVRALTKLRLPEYRQEGALAGAVHGAGLIVIAGAAVTGALWWGLRAVEPQLARQSIALHEPLATLAWVFVIAHASLALLHELSGHRVLGAMFARGRSNDR